MQYKEDMELYFITGNQGKADYLAKYLKLPVKHKKIELDEIQSLDLRKIVEHKVRQAYSVLGKPVIVEDVSLEFKAWKGLTGPFIRFFVENIPFKELCSLVNRKTRKAIGRCIFGYCDGSTVRLFEGALEGEIARTPSGKNGFGWDRIFIPKGYKVTRASLGEKDDKKTYLQLKPFAKLKKFLSKK